MPAAHGVGQRGVFADGDERAAQAADGTGGEQPALLHGVVEHGHGGGRAGGADPLDAQRLEDLADAVADGRRGGQRKIDDAEGHAQFGGHLAADQLAHPRDAEAGDLDLLGQVAQA